MSGVREVVMEGSGPRSGAASGEPEASREVRWSARRKELVVLRLLRGESLDLLARETGQPAGRIAAWREEFLAAGREGLKSRPAPEADRRLTDAQSGRSVSCSSRSTSCMHCWKKLLAVTKKDVIFVGDRLSADGNDYPVKAMGVDCLEVSGWRDTALVIRTILEVTQMTSGHDERPWATTPCSTRLPTTRSSESTWSPGSGSATSSTRDEKNTGSSSTAPAVSP